MQFAKCQFWLAPRHRLRFEIFDWKISTTGTFFRKNPMIYHPRRCVTGQNPCNYPPGYSNSWFRLIEALVRGEKCCEMAIFQSIWSKSDPSWPLPCPTYLPFLTKRGEILKFRQKYVKVHKICYILCPNRKKWQFWGRTPPYRLKQAELVSTLTRKTEKSQNLDSRLRCLAKNRTRDRK